jgi:UDP-N-acetylglucosamine--N-acetylmuramyl-(pentapeptide) pyrophosphoryl-undecaprenol N-acetylglucosamine transferase
MPGSHVLFIGTRRKLDREHLEHYGFTVKTVHSLGLKGKSLPALLKALAILPVTFCQACYQILRFKPHVVCGVGGYVTGPVVAAASILGIPTVIHEQNSIPGMANRKLGRVAGKVCVSLPDSKDYFPIGKTVLTGNPVRSAILELSSLSPQLSRKTALLVLGGSQGAHAINELMVELFCTKDDDFGELKVIHQTGKADEKMVAEAYEKAGIDALVSAFFADMAEIYGQADIVVSRAGATTLAELAVLGKPALLIPYPYAADNHQEKNGAWYAAGGGAVLLQQNDLTVEKLKSVLEPLIAHPEKRQQMSEAMRQLGIPNAAERIVDICLQMSKK